MRREPKAPFRCPLGGTRFKNLIHTALRQGTYIGGSGPGRDNTGGRTHHGGGSPPFASHPRRPWELDPPLPALTQPGADLESSLAPPERRRPSSEKEELRRRLLARRQALSLEVIERDSARIIRRFFRLHAARGGRWLSCYVAFGREVRTRPLIEEALRRGWRVAIPVVPPERGGLLLLSEVKDLEAEVVQGGFGLWEPRGWALRPIAIEVIDCFVVPGVAFDRGGRRLGFGRGYYDRLLVRARPDAWRIGIAFSCQVVDRLPAHPGDILVHRVITEEGVWRGPPRAARWSPPDEAMAGR